MSMCFVDMGQSLCTSRVDCGGARGLSLTYCFETVSTIGHPQLKKGVQTSRREALGRQLFITYLGHTSKHINTAAISLLVSGFPYLMPPSMPGFEFYSHPSLKMDHAVLRWLCSIRINSDDAGDYRKHQVPYLEPVRSGTFEVRYLHKPMLPRQLTLLLVGFLEDVNPRPAGREAF